MQRTTLKLQAFALIAFSAASSSAAFAENCKALPFGPEKKACVMREHPDMFEAKQERCRQLARERGDTPRTGTGAGGMREFVQDCMRANNNNRASAPLASKAALGAGLDRVRGLPRIKQFPISDSRAGNQIS